MGMRISPELAARCLELASDKPAPLAERISESEFQSAIVELAKQHGWKCFHVTIARRSKSGWFDLTMLHECRRLVIFAELKVKTVRSADQITWGEIASAIGGNVSYHCWRPEDWPDVVKVITGQSK